MKGICPPPFGLIDLQLQDMETNSGKNIKILNQNSLSWRVYVQVNQDRSIGTD